MFKRRAPAVTHADWLVVGLGNPGPEYKGTRHNVGFDFIDLLAGKLRAKLDRSGHRAIYGIASFQDQVLVMVKPLTFMNLSGQSVAPLCKQFGVPASKVLVVADDLALPVGKLRLRLKGSAGGHNGHKSLIASLQTDEYPRIKIGIGNSDGDTIDFVLGRFTPSERVDIEAALRAGIDALEAFVSRDAEAAQRVLEKYNSGKG